jgi:hypothetical protein
MYKLDNEQRLHMVNRLAKHTETWDSQTLLSYAYCREYDRLETQSDKDLITAFVRLVLKEEVNLPTVASESYEEGVKP